MCEEELLKKVYKKYEDKLGQGKYSEEWKSKYEYRTRMGWLFFCFLRETIQSNGRMGEDIDERINNTTKVYHALNKTFII